MANEPGVVNGVLVRPEPYFWNLIGRYSGQNANDYTNVLKNLQIMGMWVNPGPGEKATCETPFYGLSLMVADGGNGDPRGRIWLPTEIPTIGPDGNEWFLREVQVIRRVDANNHVWDWQELGGQAYAPLICDGDQNPHTDSLPPEDQVTKEEVQKMIDEAMKPALKVGDGLTLKTQKWGDNPGRYLCADREKNMKEAPVIANRDDADNFETFTVGRKQ